MTPIARFGHYTGDFAESMAGVQDYADEDDYKYYLDIVTLDRHDLASLPPSPDDSGLSYLFNRRYRQAYRERERAIQKIKVIKAKAMAEEVRERKLRASRNEKFKPAQQRGYLNTVRTNNITSFHVLFGILAVLRGL